MTRIVFYTVILLCVATMCYAAFPVKYPPAATNATVTSNVTIENKVVIKHHTPSSIMRRIKDRVLAPWEPGEGDRAMFWATWGIFIWPLGILAIVHGIRGLNSRRGMEQDRATLGLIFGIGETLLFIGAIIWFIFFLFYF